MSTGDCDGDKDKDNELCSRTQYYECLGDALDALDMGIKVDHANLRDLATRSLGPFESELTFETGDGKPISIDFPCTKNPGHTSFIPVSEFKPENIPEQHRTKKFYDRILSSANLVVKVVVKRVSRNRPEVYSDTKIKFPDSSEKFRGTTRKIRVGSGYVVSGFGQNQPYTGQFCPCHLCRDSGQRREFWSLNIATVTHVIYDSSEARDSVFEFFYDSEDEKGVDFMYGTDSFEQIGKNTEKICIVRCVTHDRDLFKRLMNVISRCQSLSISQEELKFENDPAVLISHPHGKCKCITMGNFVNLTVPSGSEFPINRPITFTRTAECRLPLLPWKEKTHCNAENARSETEYFNETTRTRSQEVVSEESATKTSPQKGNNYAPLPTPLSYPDDTETYMEANGFFVINVGKCQNVLSPGLFRRESDKHEIKTKNELATVAKAGDKTNRNAEDLLEYFYDGCNFRCVNVDDDTVYTIDDYYFGETLPPRGMRLEGLKKITNDSAEPEIPNKMDAQNLSDMYQLASYSIDAELNTENVVPDATNPSKISSSDITEGKENAIMPEKSVTDEKSNVTNSLSLSCNAMGDEAKEVCEELKKEPLHCNNADSNYTEEHESGMKDEGKPEKEKSRQVSSENEHEKNTNEETCFENDKKSPDSPNETIDNINSNTSISGASDNMKTDPDNDNAGRVAKREERESVAGEDIGSESSREANKNDDVCPEGATADLSIPEMLQILIDKGINLFPESDNDTNMTDADMINEFMYALFNDMDGLPLVSTLNKIYEDVATKTLKPLTLDPGSQFNLPEGMTFTLPEHARFALCFHDLTTSWFSFPPGTIFHTSESQQVAIPDDAEFSFKCQSAVQGFLTYKLDSCPGSSGGLVLLGMGKWSSGHVAHSGQFDDQSHENRSSLRRWMIYIN